MSNRVRILLIWPNEKRGISSLVGSRAVAQLREYYKQCHVQAAVTWTLDTLGQPRAVRTTQPPPPLPQLPTWKLAKYIWDATPRGAGQQLIITREPRYFNWKHSEANPTRLGFTKVPKKPKVPDWNNTPSITFDTSYGEAQNFNALLQAESKKKPPKKKKLYQYAIPQPPGEAPVAAKKQGLRVGIWN
jgi:hypothetical protein